MGHQHLPTVNFRRATQKDPVPLHPPFPAPLSPFPPAHTGFPGTGDCHFIDHICLCLSCSLALRKPVLYEHRCLQTRLRSENFHRATANFHTLTKWPQEPLSGLCVPSQWPSLPTLTQPNRTSGWNMGMPRSQILISENWALETAGGLCLFLPPASCVRLWWLALVAVHVTVIRTPAPKACEDSNQMT